MPNFLPPPSPPDFVLPTIHLGGSSPRFLLEDYTAARNAVDEAVRKIIAIDLHSRDYHTQESGAFQKACQQRVSQLQRLDSVRNELVKIEEHIDKHLPKEEMLPISAIFDKLDEHSP